MNKKIVAAITFVSAVACLVTFTGCSESKNPNSPGVEFMPDMYRSVALEGNMAYVKINDGVETGDTIQANRLPVSGTIARGFMPYPFPNTNEGYEAAGANLKNPIANNEANLKEGEVLYGKYCVHCHGASGAGDGKVAAKLPGPPPPYSDKKDLPDGKMFHSIYYGKNLMGSHASQLNKEEIWKVILHIRKLQFPNGIEQAPVVEEAKADKK